MSEYEKLLFHLREAGKEAIALNQDARRIDTDVPFGRAWLRKLDDLTNEVRFLEEIE